MVIFPNEVHIWFVNLSNQINLHQALDTVLSEDETIRSRQFAFSYLKDRFITCRATLRILLGYYLNESAKEIQFNYGEYGKPILTHKNNKIQFNLSHSEDQAVYAFSWKNEVGIDIEHIKENDFHKGIEKIILSARELSDFEKLPYEQRINRFYELWTCKEAVLKGIGCGLMYPLTELEIDVKDSCDFRVLRKDLASWNLHPLPSSSKYRGAIAIKGQNKKLIFKQLDCII